MFGRSLPRRQFLAAASLTALAGCSRTTVRPAESDWPMFGHDPRNTGHNPQGTGPTSSISVRWQRDVGASSAPVVVGGTLYVASDGGSGVRAIDAADGSTRWEFTRPTAFTMPAVANGLVCAGTADGRIYGLSPGGGHELLGTRFGARKWKRETRSSVASPPTIRGDAVVVGGFAGRVTMVSTAGTLEWAFRAAGDAVETAPAVANGRIHFSMGGLRGGAVFGIDAGTGETDWRFPVGDFPKSAPAVADGTVYAGTDTDGFYALDGGTGRLEWQRPIGEVEASPAVARGTVYVPTLDGELYALDGDTGDVQWRTTVRERVTSSPAVVSQTVYVGTRQGQLLALDTRTGNERWGYDLRSPVETAPAVAGNAVYVTTADGRLWALERRR